MAALHDPIQHATRMFQSLLLPLVRHASQRAALATRAAEFEHARRVGHVQHAALGALVDADHEAIDAGEKALHPDALLLGLGQHIVSRVSAELSGGGGIVAAAVLVRGCPISG